MKKLCKLLSIAVHSLFVAFTLGFCGYAAWIGWSLVVLLNKTV